MVNPSDELAWRRVLKLLPRVGSRTADKLIARLRGQSDPLEALVRVNSRLSQVPEYPPDADEPVVSTSDASDRPIAWFILSPLLPTAEVIAQFQEDHPQIH